MKNCSGRGAAVSGNAGGLTFLPIQCKRFVGYVNGLIGRRMKHLLPVLTVFATLAVSAVSAHESEEPPPLILFSSITVIQAPERIEIDSSVSCTLTDNVLRCTANVEAPGANGGESEGE